VLHGDEFDTVVMAHKWLAFAGDAAYEFLMKLNVGVNWSAAAATCLLVAVQARQAQGQERGRVHLALREAVAHEPAG
jgi:UDP-2,3-diacylglucosamine pyrophosphatase LpxH